MSESPSSTAIPSDVRVPTARSAARVIQAAGTSTAAFVGLTGGAPLVPTMVRSQEEFDDLWHKVKPETGSHVEDAVTGFFLNGGTACYVVGCPSLDLGTVRTALAGLEQTPQVNIVGCPDAWSAPEPTVVNAAMVDHCARMSNRMAILDAPPTIGPEQLAALRNTLSSQQKQFATLYYPWVKVPGLAGQSRAVPPSGHVAGAWARTDAKRGVHKAPTNETLAGVVEPARTLDEDEHTTLTGIGVNLLRPVPGQAVSISGARTLSTDADYQYLNIRRLVCFLTDSIKQNTTWAVFEPNDEVLWAGLRHSIAAFLTDQWRSGALAGQTPDQAFTIVCDETNNPPTQRGIVKVDISIAPARPAEFVVMTIKQTAEQSR